MSISNQQNSDHLASIDLTCSKKSLTEPTNMCHFSLLQHMENVICSEMDLKDSPLRAGFNPRKVHVKFIKVAQKGQVFL
jgi:hypothetical protein